MQRFNVARLVTLCRVFSLNRLISLHRKAFNTSLETVRVDKATNHFKVDSQLYFVSSSATPSPLFSNLTSAGQCYCSPQITLQWMKRCNRFNGLIQKLMWWCVDGHYLFFMPHRWLSTKFCIFIPRSSLVGCEKLHRKYWILRAPCLINDEWIYALVYVYRFWCVTSYSVNKRFA